MRPSFLPLVLAIVLAFPLQAAAQTEVPSVATAAPAAAHKGASALTLAEAIKLAFEGNPGLRTAMRDIDIAAGELIQAGTDLTLSFPLFRRVLKKNRGHELYNSVNRWSWVANVLPAWRQRASEEILPLPIWPGTVPRCALTS